MTRRLAALAIAVLALACGDREGRSAPAAEASAPPADTLDVAIFAGGCFWCVEEAFDAVPGVVRTTSGYIGGRGAEPTYEQVSSGGTGHAEAVRVIFDPRRVSYDRLLAVFWRNIDPTDAGGQFCDRGDQYRSAIFTRNAAQRRRAEASKARIERTKPFDEAVVTPIVEAATFWEAEEYHQDYHQRNSLRYKVYKFGCGRERRLDRLWGDG